MRKIMPVLMLCFACTGLRAQELCSVGSETLKGTYTGECKNGMANGKGEATGYHRYSGDFKNGLPSGKGVYTFQDSSFYNGAFLAGLKEGKGEMHYLRAGKADSVIKGYWSGNVYRGKEYKTYNVTGGNRFDRFEILPSDQPGNTVTIETSTTTGSPNGAPGSLNGGPGYVLTLREIYATNGVFIRKLSEFNSATKASMKFELDRFPAKFVCTLSSGENFELELYKSASWMVRIYVNK